MHSWITCSLSALSFVFSVSLATAGDLQFKKHVINPSTDYSAAGLVDVNRDGKIDIVCGGDWYESPDWNKHFVADIPRIGGRPDGFSHLEFDVNRDGWADIITVNYRSRSIKWMEHPGEQQAAWKIRTVVEPGPMETGRLVDVNGDGQLDLLPNGRGFAAWWEFRWKPGLSKGNPAWIRHELPKDAEGHGAGFGDIDGDGRSDIVGQNGWLKAPADARFGKWKWYPEFSIERGSIPMLVVDPDEDGDNDIVWCSAHGFGVYWLEQVQDENGQREWRRHAIDTSWSQGHAPLWADMDSDGRKELIAGKRYMSHGGSDPGAYDPMRIYRYQFNLETRTWDRWSVSDSERVSMGLDPKVADIDNDGDLDLVTSGRSGLYWLENLGPDTTVTSESVARVSDNANPLVVSRTDGQVKAIDNPGDWGRQRDSISRAIRLAHGGLPTPSQRVALDVQVKSKSAFADYTTQTLSYAIDEGRQTNAVLYIPDNAEAGATSGVVCMFDPSQSQDATLAARELVAQGYVCLVPTLLGPSQHGTVIDSTWQSMRAADVLQARREVHGEKLGYVGGALLGRLGLYVAALDQRFIATLTDSRRFGEFSVQPSERYRVTELMALVAPRSLGVALADDSQARGAWKSHANNAAKVFSLRKASKNLMGDLSLADGDDRAKAFAWFRSKLRP